MADFRGPPPPPPPPMGMPMHPGGFMPPHQPQQYHRQPQQSAYRPAPLIIVDKKPKYAGCTFTLPDSSGGKNPSWSKATQTIWNKSQDEMMKMCKKKMYGHVDVTDGIKLEDLPLEAQRRIENWREDKYDLENEPELYKWSVALIKEKSKGVSLFGSSQSTIEVILKRTLRSEVKESANSPTARSPRLNRSNSYSSDGRQRPGSFRRSSFNQQQFPMNANFGMRPGPGGMMPNGQFPPRPGMPGGPLNGGMGPMRGGSFSSNSEDSDDDSDQPPNIHPIHPQGMGQGQFRPHGMPGSMPGMPGPTPGMPGPTPGMPGMGGINGMPGVGPGMQPRPGGMMPGMGPHGPMPMGGMPRGPPFHGPVPRPGMNGMPGPMPQQVHLNGKPQLHQQRQRRDSGGRSRSRSRPEIINAFSSDDESVLTSTDDNLSTRTPLTSRSLGEEVPYRKGSMHRRGSQSTKFRSGENAYRMHKRRNSQHRRAVSDDDHDWLVVNNSRRRDARYVRSGASRRGSFDEGAIRTGPRGDTIRAFERELRRTEVAKREREMEQLQKDFHDLEIKGRDMKIDDLRRKRDDLERHLHSQHREIRSREYRGSFSDRLGSPLRRRRTIYGDSDLHSIGNDRLIEDRDFDDHRRYDSDRRRSDLRDRDFSPMRRASYRPF